MSSETRRDQDRATNPSEITFEAYPGEYVDVYRADLEAITEEVSPVLPIIQALLDKRDRGEIEC